MTKPEITIAPKKTELLKSLNEKHGISDHERLEELRERKEAAELELSERRCDVDDAKAALYKAEIRCDSARRAYEEWQDAIEGMKA
jgi:hypothetical protein